MPLSNKHKQQRTKNLAFLAILIGLVAAVYFISIIKLGQTGA